MKVRRGSFFGQKAGADRLIAVKLVLAFASPKSPEQCVTHLATLANTRDDGDASSSCFRSLCAWNLRWFEFLRAEISLLGICNVPMVHAFNFHAHNLQRSEFLRVVISTLLTSTHRICNVPNFYA